MRCSKRNISTVQLQRHFQRLLAGNRSFPNSPRLCRHRKGNLSGTSSNKVKLQDAVGEMKFVSRRRARDITEPCQRPKRGNKKLSSAVEKVSSA